ncbi:replication-relaxation family protein [Streptomyces sp. NPDC058441]|uniref:replication-relaxation family protein n=1 Tax=Streptomyces sp. NPDC058441 TaxID=3346502 RepID=UPI0036506A2E
MTSIRPLRGPGSGRIGRAVFHLAVHRPSHPSPAFSRPETKSALKSPHDGEPKPDRDLVVGESAEAVAAAQAAVDAPKGIGTFTSYATEVALPVKGTWKNPAIGSARADVVVIAPDDGVPLLFIEVDNCTEEAVLIAAKFDKYARFFKRKEKDTDGIEKPVWRTRLGGIRACAPAGPAHLPPGRQALREEPGGEGGRPHPPPLAGPVASRGRNPLLRWLHPHRGDPVGAAA